MMNDECQSIQHSTFSILHSTLNLHCSARQLQVAVHLAKQALQHRARTHLDDGTHTRGKDIAHGLRPHNG